MRKFDCPLKGLELAKKHVCFIGPTSVGKSTLYNQVFDLSLETGLGSCTKEAMVIKTTKTTVYWDAPGINDDFGFYRSQHLGFFQKMSKVIILFDRDINDIRFIIELLAKMKIPRVHARTKCDLWKKGMKPIEEQLKIDEKEASEYDEQCKQVIPVGFGMYNKIMKELMI